ncbi:MAG: response regulator [bacterium]|nr:response regulator [bacterium]MDZ4284318.1 response regulator [Patescibacteria group bacterium]
MSTTPPLRHIMLCEDDLPITRALALKLTRAGYHTTVASSGVDAIELLGQTHYDLIILDLVMPNKDGFEVLAELREADKRTPVIIWSNLSQSEDVARARALGVEDYWFKYNTSLREVVDRVRAFFAKT